jgi:hypothetical protein
MTFVNEYDIIFIFFNIPRHIVGFILFQEGLRIGELFIIGFWNICKHLLWLYRHIEVKIRDSCY